MNKWICEETHHEELIETSIHLHEIGLQQHFQLLNIITCGCGVSA